MSTINYAPSLLNPFVLLLSVSVTSKNRLSQRLLVTTLGKSELNRLLHHD
jgi:hypothetical protein